MRLIRAGAIVLLVLCLLAGGLAAAILHNQARLVGAVLHHIAESTGYQIAAADSRVRFGVHLNLLLEHPRVQHAGRELVTADSIRVVVGYHSLIWNNGLPLQRIIVNRPQIRVPAPSGVLGFASPPRLDNATVRAMIKELRDFSGLVKRLTIAKARVSDENGAPLFNDFSITAAAQHRNSPVWVVAFTAPQIETPLKGLQVTGKMTINTVARGAAQIASSGELRYGRVKLSQGIADVTIGGLAQGDLNFVLRADGELDGSANLRVSGLELTGARLARKLDFGDCSLRTLFAISAQRVALAGIEARVQGTTVMSANATLSDPYAANAELLTRLGGAQIDLHDLKTRLSATRGLPQRLEQLAARLVSGQLMIEGAAYQAPLNKLAWTPAALLNHLAASARLKGVSVELPGTAGLPALSQIDAQIAYAKGRVTLTQGSASLGGSSFQDVSGEVDLRPGRRELRYRLNAAGRLDLDDLYPATRRAFPAFAKQAAAHIDRLSGTAAVRMTASGVFDPNAPEPPANYQVKIETSGFSVAAKGIPQTVALVGGSATLTPRAIELTHVDAASRSQATPGNVILDGSLDLDGATVRPRRITVEMHQIEAQQWLPLLVDSADVAARGPVGGSVTVAYTARRRSGLRAEGRLTMGAGEIQLGFLRSPIVARSATLTLDGRGLLLAIMGAKLEGSPLDFSLGVADLEHPALRIEANAGQLDLEVMKFIHVPWAPSPPAHFFPIPAAGHIVANEAHLERLQMSQVSCDFERKANGDWRVYNFAANVYKGHADMEFVGRGRDNWLNIKGHTNAIRVGSLFRLANPTAAPPLRGRLNAKFEIWADADTDFFDTMKGAISVDVSKGVLYKFALLSRILGLIDLKTWLSAKVPDPRINGVRFDSLTADFKGEHGEFYSDNLLLRGPVMNISSQGYVRLSDGDVDMEVGMVPFKTVNWLVGKVPIIGEGLAANHLLAAYFKVSGPLGNPHVVPMPITSVAHFFTYILKLPISILQGVGQGVGGANSGNSGGGSGGSSGVDGGPSSGPPN